MDGQANEQKVAQYLISLSPQTELCYMKANASENNFGCMKDDFEHLAER